ncbi:MAG: cadherin-like beta sandwich domain-containing protein [Candidatus Thiodiazotropha endolucinida]
MNYRFNQKWLWTIFQTVVVLILLSGCGGGSGSEDEAGGSSHASLSELGLAGAMLDQLFQPSQSVYSASVGFLQASVTLTPVASDVGATIHVNNIEVTCRPP